MSFLQDLARTLLHSGTPVQYQDSADDRTHKEQFLVDGQEAEIEYFDGEPQQFRWGFWRCNKDGEPL